MSEKNVYAGSLMETKNLQAIRNPEDGVILYPKKCGYFDKDISKIYEAINLLMDRTKPSQIGFDTK